MLIHKNHLNCKTNLRLDTWTPVWRKVPSMASLHTSFPGIEGFPSWRWVQYYIMHISRLAVMMWRQRPGPTFYPTWICRCYWSFLLPFFLLSFFFVFKECSGHICVHLCVCLPVTWNKSSSFINVEPPRLSKHNLALNGWLCLLLWPSLLPPTEMLLLLRPIWLYT